MTQTFDPARHANDEPLFTQETSNLTASEIASALSISVGSATAGAISVNGEQDFFAVTLEAGKTYTIDGFAEDSNRGTLSETDLHLYDSAGRFIEYDDLGGSGYDASITYSVASTGTYYIMVDSYFTADTGTYVLQVEQDVALPPPGTTGTHQELAEFLKSGTNNGVEYTWNTSQSNVITVNITGLTAEGQQLAKWAMDAWEMVCNLDFQLVSSGEMITCDDEDSGAFAYYPNTGSTSVAGGDNTNGVELNVSKSWLSTYGTRIDSYSFQTYVHEFGHAIGLNHLGNYNFNPNGPSITYQNSAYFTNDSWQMSVMSYFSQSENTSTNSSFGYLAGPMMADILAAQDFYGAPGANTATAGDTVFGLGSNLGNYLDEVFEKLATGQTSTNVGINNMAFTLYDQGGTDLLDLSFLDANQGSDVDLNGGTFSDVAGRIANFGIADGTVIENLKLGAGQDSITGNAADNVIEAGAGNDTVYGGGGNDVLDGGSGTDIASFSGNAGQYSFFVSGNMAAILDTTGQDGVNLLSGFESYVFSDSSYNSASFSEAATQFESLRYIASHGDLMATYGADSAAGFSHYLSTGMAQGREVSFRALDYLASHQDLIDQFGADTEAASGHYIEVGAAEGWGISFSGLQYIATHADLRAAFGANNEAAALHYIQYGASEGRTVNFSALNYLASHADVRAAFGADTEAASRHYIQYGANEGRLSNFKGLEYIASYADLRAVFGTDAEGAALHYITSGVNEGRVVSFSGLEYLASHADLRAVFGTDVFAATEHYIIHGAGEGRTITFDGMEYIASYADLRAVFGTDSEGGTLHFLTSGEGEGRTISFSGLDYLGSHTTLLAQFGGDAQAATVHYITQGADDGLSANARAGFDALTASQTGTAGADVLTGSSAAEILAGMGGDDTLMGGGADDVLAGGAGSDVFVFADGFGNDVIADFDAQDANEKINLSGLTGITDEADLFLNHIATVDGVVTIVDAADSIALLGVDYLDLDTTDFDFSPLS